jgi:imidazole glycerol-phosphate synthase subunit HisH
VNEGTIVVLDYGIGNLASAEKAFVHLGARARLVREPAEVRGAAGVVLPGVGAFGRCASALEESGLGAEARWAIESGLPFLGICVGFQLLYEDSAESPGARGLGFFGGTVGPLAATVKCPQMQWNRLVACGDRPSGLLDGVGDAPFVYFVHSYAPPVGPETVALCEYGGPVAAAAERDNVWGTQFHPEKSSTVGLGVLANFVARCGARTPASAS